MTTPNYTLHQSGSDDGSRASLVAFPSIGSPWITERPTPGKTMTVHQAMVLFTATAENEIILVFENRETSKGTVLVKLAGTQEWLAPGSILSLEEFINLLNTCYVHTCPEPTE